MSTHNRINLQKTLYRLNACPEAIEWASGYTSAISAWRACPNGDWLLWIAARVCIEREFIVQAACACARNALIHIPKDDKRPLKAIEAAEAWCRGEATVEEVRIAVKRRHLVDWNVSIKAAYAYAACAAYAAAGAVYDDHYYADDAPVEAAGAAQAAALEAGDVGMPAWNNSLRESADIIRSIIPWNRVRAKLMARKDEGS